MPRSNGTKLDLRVLVDIISNVAGMMILLACMSLMVRQRAGEETDKADDQPRAKPIQYPLAYIPNKRSVTICMKFGKLYRLPERALLDEVAKRAARGEASEFLEIGTPDVDARIDVTPTLTGFSFRYALKPEGGIPINSHSRVLAALKEILAENPPTRCFYVFHTWPDTFEKFREIREYIHEQNGEVGWTPQDYPSAESVAAGFGEWDVSYSIGEYSENLSSIKAQ